MKKLNNKHFVETDMYYRVGYGLSSRLVHFQNEIFHLEVTISRKWTKGYNITAAEIANLWHDNYIELKSALGCKVFIKDNVRKDTNVFSNNGRNYCAMKGILFNKNYMN